MSIHLAFCQLVYSQFRQDLSGPHRLMAAHPFVIGPIPETIPGQ
jgi:hypothetical protein